VWLYEINPFMISCFPNVLCPFPISGSSHPLTSQGFAPFQKKPVMSHHAIPPLAELVRWSGWHSLGPGFNSPVWGLLLNTMLCGWSYTPQVVFFFMSHHGMLAYRHWVRARVGKQPVFNVTCCFLVWASSPRIFHFSQGIREALPLHIFRVRLWCHALGYLIVCHPKKGHTFKSHF
jgi:hypothetical protein